MTCQWCTYYRRRDGMSMCRTEDGRVVKTQGASCGRFNPRRSCTTCAYRCQPEEKDRNFEEGRCEKWVLRALATWGGDRHLHHKKASSFGPSGKDESTKCPGKCLNKEVL